MRSAPGTPAATAIFFGRLCPPPKPPSAKPRRMLVTVKKGRAKMSLRAASMCSIRSLRRRTATSFVSRIVLFGSLGNRRVGGRTDFCARRSCGRCALACAGTYVSKYGCPHATVTPSPAGMSA